MNRKMHDGGRNGAIKRIRRVDTRWCNDARDPVPLDPSRQHAALSVDRAGAAFVTDLQSGKRVGWALGRVEEQGPDLARAKGWVGCVRVAAYPASSPSAACVAPRARLRAQAAAACSMRDDASHAPVCPFVSNLLTQPPYASLQLPSACVSLTFLFPSCPAHGTKVADTWIKPNAPRQLTPGTVVSFGASTRAYKLVRVSKAD